MSGKVRNLITRATTGVTFISVLIGGTLYSPQSFCILFGAITALTLWEFGTLVNQKPDIEINRFITTVSGTYLFFAFAAFCLQATSSTVFIPYLVSIIYIMISELYMKKSNPINNWGFAFASQIYIALPFSLLNVLTFQLEPCCGQVTFCPIYSLSIFAFLWANDTGAYCTGSLIGKHKLFPRISPHKSWEGSIGGGILAIVVSQIFAHFFQDINAYKWMGLALVIVFFGTWGDLVESQIKRQLKVKDSGKILPGHGGLLDRFDSALIAFPAAVIYLYTLTLFHQ